ncbi:hypothetical protein BDZ90DRAFT_262909 [Jaminaea rosea]|uniref:Uncharacterized protein n=1 Tax=Jaminaea rosea TaxID=1569628 RepID=A0A316UIJ5_9BASI|nr:hypothetical protein BDZ90DRAFT_262909 [Jaminaea rosea]PWN24688.1 hypothetical protein BDZ90DRAFT_262909 [Jaminaea rosea]
MPSSVTIALFVSLGVIAVVGYRISRGGGGRGGGVGKYDPKTGIGRGAPGFQTNVTRIAVPAHIVARIRAGEDVSAEEITAAQEAEAKKQAKLAKSGKSGKPSTPRSDPANEWIPEGHSTARGTKGKRI